MRCNQWCGGVLVAALGLAGLTTPSHGAVVTDPVLVFDSNAIDPAGAQSVNANAASTNLTDQTVLEAIESFGAVQDFTGFAAFTASGTPNFFAFTDPLRADVRVTPTNNGSTTLNGGTISDNSFMTSAGAGMRIFPPGGGTVGVASTMAVTLTFGSYDADTLTFMSHELTTWAAGFTLSALFVNQSATVEFLDSDGAVLSTQIAIGVDSDPGESTGWEYYFGYLGDKRDPSSYVGSIVITREWTDGVRRTVVLDDLAWVTIPEPTAAMLLGVGLMGVVGRRRG